MIWMKKKVKTKKINRDEGKKKGLEEKNWCVKE